MHLVAYESPFKPEVQTAEININTKINTTICFYCCSLPIPRALEGALEPNTRLLEGIKILEGKIRGPECLAEYKGEFQQYEGQ